MTSPNMSCDLSCNLSRNVSFNNLQDDWSGNDSNVETNLSPEHSDSCDMDAALDYSSPSLSAVGSPVSFNQGGGYGYSPSPESMKLTKGFYVDNNTNMTNMTNR